MIEKKFRDEVLSIMAEPNTSKRKILCNLRGLDYHMVKKYSKIAQFEKDFFLQYSDFDVHLVQNTDEYFKLYIFDNVKFEFDDYNSGFGIKRQFKRYDFNLKVPKTLFSEWMQEIFKLKEVKWIPENTKTN